MWILIHVPFIWELPRNNTQTMSNNRQEYRQYKQYEITLFYCLKYCFHCLIYCFDIVIIVNIGLSIFLNIVYIVPIVYYIVLKYCLKYCFIILFQKHCKYCSLVLKLIQAHNAPFSWKFSFRKVLSPEMCCLTSFPWFPPRQRPHCSNSFFCNAK